MSDKTVVCIGAALIDEIYISKTDPKSGTSNPATRQRSAGGVARNIAQHLAMLGNSVELITHFGEDEDGKFLIEKCEQSNVGIGNSKFNQTPTGHFTALLSPDGELFSAASATYFEEELDVTFLTGKNSVLAKASLLLVDCNLSTHSIRWILDFSRTENIPVIIEPVSIEKAKRLVDVNLDNVFLITPNSYELKYILGDSKEDTFGNINTMIKSRGVQNIWFRNGKEGSQFYSAGESFAIPAPHINVIDSIGAGDAALAGWIHAWLGEKSLIDCMRYGHSLAMLVLQTKGAVLKNLTSQILEKALRQAQ